MIRTNLLNPTESHKVVTQKGCFAVIEYEKDISVSPKKAMEAYYASKMNVRKKQLIAQLDGENGVIAQRGAMQLLLGPIGISNNIKGAGDLVKKFVGSKVTGETTFKPLFVGEGTMVFEPTFKHIILLDMNDWTDGLVVEDGMFLACEDTVDLVVTARTNLSSAVLGGEGLFSTTMVGTGTVAVESNVPEDEVIWVELENDELRVDSSIAIAWSYGLEFTVEKSTKSLIGSFASGEGLVNVYRGTGKVLIAPVEKNRNISKPETAHGSEDKKC